MKDKKRFLISTLAEYQTVFWVRVGRELSRLAHEVAFVSFDDRSTEMLRASGFTVYCLSDIGDAIDTSDAALDAAMHKYGMHHLNYWMSHERFAFGVQDGRELRRKLLSALALGDHACQDWSRQGGSVCMVQELGGFLSVVGCFFAARAQGIDHWFIEPAFFKGRLFFLRNTFAAMSIGQAPSGPLSDDMVSYLAAARLDGTVVIPQKDKHQYAPALRKIVNWRNAKRLVSKTVDKYVRGKRQEFGYIGSYVGTHLRMLRNSVRLRRHYTPLETLGSFIYYPLHVPGDMALTLRSPQYLDQLALIDYIARAVPHTHQVAIKEHPAMIGAIDAARLRQLILRYDNLHLIAPDVNNYRLMTAADAIVSVNSKSGAEAILLGKPVIVLGDAFYTRSPFVCHVEKLSNVSESLQAAIGHSRPSFESDEVDRYFEAVWRQCLPGELYVTQTEQVKTFTHSMVAATRDDLALDEVGPNVTVSSV